MMPRYCCPVTMESLSTKGSYEGYDTIRITTLPLFLYSFPIHILSCFLWLTFTLTRLFTDLLHLTPHSTS